MNNSATIEKMNQMKLYGMVRAFRTTFETRVSKRFTADELVAHLVDAEWDDRHNRRLNRLIKAARFRYQSSFEQLDFNLKRALDKNMMLRFSDSGWIEKHYNIIVTGPTGIGKSFIASAFGNTACMHGFKTRYFNCAKLFELLKMAKAQGTYIKEIKRIEK